MRLQGSHIMIFPLSSVVYMQHAFLTSCFSSPAITAVLMCGAASGRTVQHYSSSSAAVRAQREAAQRNPPPSSSCSTSKTAFQPTAAKRVEKWSLVSRITNDLIEHVDLKLDILENSETPQTGQDSSAKSYNRFCNNISWQHSAHWVVKNLN